MCHQEIRLGFVLMCLYMLLVAYYALMQHIFLPTDNSSFSSLCRYVTQFCVRLFDQLGLSSHLHFECYSPPSFLSFPG